MDFVLCLKPPSCWWPQPPRNNVGQDLAVAVRTGAREQVVVRMMFSKYVCPLALQARRPPDKPRCCNSCFSFNRDLSALELLRPASDIWCSLHTARLVTFCDSECDVLYFYFRGEKCGVFFTVSNICNWLCPVFGDHLHWYDTSRFWVSLCNHAFCNSKN